MLRQSQPVVPPKPSDSMLRDFAQIIDKNLKDLFLVGHEHKILTALPTSKDGSVGDIYLVDISGSKKLCVKLPGGWYAVSLTAI